MACRVRVLWAETAAEWDATTARAAASLVPAHLRDRMPRYRRWQDRQMGLLGKLLLRYGLAELGVDPAVLQRMTWSQPGRPALPLPGDFNITHSGGVVAVALAADARLGLDVERIHPIAVADLQAVLTDAERAAIAQAADPDREVCRLWTFKEAVVKADGRGVGIDLRQIDSLATTNILDGAAWHTQPLSLHASVACHLASDRAPAALALHLSEVDLAALLEPGEGGAPSC